MKSLVKKHVPVLFLVVYLLFIFYITLFSRSYSFVRSCNLEMFWSYITWFKGNAMLGREILLNIALFVPFGYFLTDVLQGWNIKRAGVTTVIVSLVIATAIETVQFIDGLGYCEFDDVFNNVLGSCLGIGFFRLCSYCISADHLQKWKLVISILFLIAGVAGCNMVSGSGLLPPYKSLTQFDFDIKQVSSDGKNLSLQGYCYAYKREMPSYHILLRGEQTGKLYKGVTKVDGKTFLASVPVDTEEKYHVLVQFKIYQPVSTFTYVNNNRVEYVSGTVVDPDIRDTDLGMIVRNGILKVYEPKFDVYVYQFNRRLYWLIGSPIDKRTEIIFHLHTNEPDRLPEHRKKYKFDNRGFRAGAKNELTRQMRCGKYRVFEREIPKEYNITAVWVGFNTGGKITWSRWFRVETGCLSRQNNL